MRKIKNIKKLMWMPILLMVLMISVPPVSAYDANTPYVISLNLIVPTDSTFTVALAGAETKINFNPATKDTAQVEPDSQVAAGNATPMLTITNAGNVNLDFSANLTAAKPSWVVLKVSDNGSYADALTFDTVMVNSTNWSTVAVASDAYMYLWADFTAATGGNTSRNFQVSANTS